MPLFDWIRSDLHSLDLDWIISKIKTVEESEQGAVDAAADANASKSAAAASATAANNSKNAAAGSATLAAVSAQQAQNLVDQLDTTIAQDVTDWLDEHITPTTPAVDDTLTVSGAAADAAVTGDKITELKTEINNVGEIVGLHAVPFTEIDGSYITANGGISDSPTFSRSAPVAVTKGTHVIFKARGYNTSVAMITLVNEDGTNLRPQVVSIDSTVREYEYTATQDCYIALSYNKNYTHELTFDDDYIVAINGKINSIATFTEVTPENLNTGYIHRDGRIMEGPNFRYTNPIRLENEKITFTARGYSDVVSLLSVCDADGNGRKNIVNSTAGEVEKTVTYTSNGVNYVIICSGVAVPIKYTKIKIDMPSNDSFVSLSMFDKFGVIGDSYASGELYFNNQIKDDYAHSWGQVMARKLGTVCTNYSRGGLTTRSWLTDSRGLPLLLNSPAEDIYYIALGINDYLKLGVDYLGSISDITGHSSYTDYPDTFYGNYGKIIEQIMNHAPHAKIVMFNMSMVSSTTVKEAFNDAIVEIADHYNIPYINQDDDLFFTSIFYNTTKVQGHPIAITYSGMACAFERLVSACIKNNVEYFKNLYWYSD